MEIRKGERENIRRMKVIRGKENVIEEYIKIMWKVNRGKDWGEGSEAVPVQLMGRVCCVYYREIDGRSIGDVIEIYNGKGVKRGKDRSKGSEVVPVQVKGEV